MADFLNEDQVKLLDEVASGNQNRKKFRLKYQGLRDHIRRLVAMQLIKEDGADYAATLGGLLISSAPRAKAIQGDYENLFRALLGRYNNDPTQSVTTSSLAEELALPKEKINYLLKLSSDFTAPRLVGSGSYGDNDAESNVEIAEEIIDFKSFSDVVKAAGDLAKGRSEHFMPPLLPAVTLDSLSAPVPLVAINASKTPKVVDKWRWKHKIAEGGQAEALLVVDAQGQKFVGKRIKNISRIKRFKTEIEALGRIADQNVVKIVDSDLASEKPFIIMEYCAGGDLSRNRFWAGNLASKFQIFRQVLSGVMAAHEAGIIHRDLKPANILLRGPVGPAVVGDFGICFLKMEEAAQRDTATMEVMGARWFLAPEYEAGFVDSPEPAGDVYSLGKLLYWLLSDGVIFPREMHRDPRWNLVAKLKDARYEHLNRFLDLALAHDSADRIQTVSELAERLIKIEKQIELRSNIPQSSLPQSCAYCGVGEYKMVAETSTQVGNFGFVVAGNPKWHILCCGQCGNIQLFREDLI